jgi:hypothetical protein
MRHKEIPISKDAFRVRMPATGAPTEPWVEARRSTKIRRDLSDRSRCDPVPRVGDSRRATTPGKLSDSKYVHPRK